MISPAHPFQDSENKHLVYYYLRTQFAKQFPILKHVPRVFTLPEDSLAFENQLSRLEVKKTGKSLQEMGRVIDGVVRDAKLFERIRRKKKSDGLNMNVFKKTDGDYWQNCTEVYDFIWLNYCDSWSDSKLKSFQSIFKNKLIRFNGSARPIIAMTVSAGPENPSMMDNLLICYDTSKRGSGVAQRNAMTRIGGIPGMLNHLADHFGLDD